MAVVYFGNSGSGIGRIVEKVLREKSFPDGDFIDNLRGSQENLSFLIG